MAEIVHACPPPGSGLTPCCGRSPIELPLSDRISSEEPATCTLPEPTREDTATRPRYTVLLARLERDRARSERGAAECKLEATAGFNEGEEAAFRAAIVHTLRVFCGPDAVAAYMRDGALPAVAAPATPGDYEAALTAEPVAREHIGGNAEECPGCDGTNPPYPFICPGPGESAG